MIVKALNRVGGVMYLARQAEENPSAFLSLLGRILPKEALPEGGSTYHLHLVAAQLVAAQQRLPPDAGAHDQPRPPLTIDGSIPTE
jgi:hypothetical protein